MITSKGTWFKIAKTSIIGASAATDHDFRKEVLRRHIIPSSEVARRSIWHCGVLSEHLTLGALSLTHDNQKFNPAAPETIFSFFFFFMFDFYVQLCGLWQTLSRRREMENDKTPLPRPEEQATEKIEAWTRGAANLWELESSNCRQEWQMLLLIESPGACSMRWHYSRPFYRIDSYQFCEKNVRAALGRHTLPWWKLIKNRQRYCGTPEDHRGL